MSQLGYRGVSGDAQPDQCVGVTRTAGESPIPRAPIARSAAVTRTSNVTDLRAPGARSTVTTLAWRP